MVDIGDTYVAMGSSFAAGPGIAPLVDRAAGRSANNYAHLVAKARGLLLTDVTCSGATTANLLNRPQLGLGRIYPPQIEAVTEDTALVTITAGGNDLGFIPDLSKIAYLTKFAGWLPYVRDLIPSPDVLQLEDPRVDSLMNSMISVVEAIQERAPGVQVIIVDYLTVLGPDIHNWSVHLSDDQIDALRSLATAHTLAMETVAEWTDATLVQASKASADHGLGSPDPWITGLTTFFNPLAGGPVPFHPTAAGMRAVADLIIPAIWAD